MLRTIVLGVCALMFVALGGCCWPGPWHGHGHGYYDRPGYSQGYGPANYQSHGPSYRRW